MVMVNAGTYLAHCMVLAPRTKNEKPSKSSMWMPLLCTSYISIKLWVAPLSTKTDTLCPIMVPLTLNVRYFELLLMLQEPLPLEKMLQLHLLWVVQLLLLLQRWSPSPHQKISQYNVPSLKHIGGLVPMVLDKWNKVSFSLNLVGHHHQDIYSHDSIFLERGNFVEKGIFPWVKHVVGL